MDYAYPGMVTYKPLIDRSARRNLHSLPREERNDLRETLKDVARREEPTHHPKVKQLEGQPGLFRVRVGGVRAVCSLQKPYLYILKVGERSTVYNDIDDIEIPDSAGIRA